MDGTTGGGPSVSLAPYQSRLAEAFGLEFLRQPCNLPILVDLVAGAGWCLADCTSFGVRNGYLSGHHFQAKPHMFPTDFHEKLAEAFDASIRTN